MNKQIRVVRERCEVFGCDLYFLREVTFKKEVAVKFSEDVVVFVGVSVDDLKEKYKQVEQAFTLPALDLNNNLKEYGTDIG